MEKLAPLKEGEAEVFVRTEDKILKVKLPPPLVKKLVAMQESMEAADLLEVLITSAERITQLMFGMKSGDHQTKKDGHSIEVSKEEDGEET